MLINGGVAGGIAKEVDDGTQLAIEAILSGATDASTGGTAGIAGMIVSGVFMLSRHGRDVILPDFTSVDVTLTRPLTLAVQTVSSSARRVSEGPVSVHRDGEFLEPTSYRLLRACVYVAAGGSET